MKVFLASQSKTSILNAMNKNIEVKFSEEEAEIIGSALMRDIRETKNKIDSGSVELYPNEYRLRLNRLRAAFASLSFAQDIPE